MNVFCDSLCCLISAHTYYHCLSAPGVVRLDGWLAQEDLSWLQSWTIVVRPPLMEVPLPALATPLELVLSLPLIPVPPLEVTGVPWVALTGGQCHQHSFIGKDWLIDWPR